MGSQTCQRQKSPVCSPAHRLARAGVKPCGQHGERKARLLDRMELELNDLEAESGRGRTRRRDGRSRLYPQEALAQPIAAIPAARTGDRAKPDPVRLPQFARLAKRTMLPSF